MKFNIVDYIKEKWYKSMVSKDPHSIGNIKNPPPALQLIALKQDTGCITLIDNPCEAAQKMAVDEDPYCLSLIAPMDSVRLWAIEKDPANIRHIPNPSEAEQMLAVQKDYTTFLIINNPAEKVQNEVMRKDPKFYHLIDNPFPSSCKTAIETFLDKKIDVPITSEILADTKIFFGKLVELDNHYQIDPPEFDNQHDYEEFYKTAYSYPGTNLAVDTHEQAEQKVIDLFLKDLDVNKYLNTRLDYMFGMGNIEFDELKDSRYEQFVNEHFPFEYKELCSFRNDPNPNKDYPYDLEGCIRLKAGEMLESKGILPVGITEMRLAEEGYKVSGLRQSLQEAYNVSGSTKDSEFKSALENNDFDKLSQLKEGGYVPSKDMLQSLSSSVSTSSVIAVQKIFGLSPDETQLPDMKLVQNVLSEKDITHSVKDNIAQAL